MAGLWRAYVRSLQQRPIVTNIVTAGTIGAAGDCIAQCLEQRKWPSDVKLNRARVGVVSLWGFVMNGAPMVWWFRFLDRRWPPPMTMRKLATKIATNQLTAAPIMNGSFFGWLIAWESVAQQHGLSTGLVHAKPVAGGDAGGASAGGNDAGEVRGDDDGADADGAVKTVLYQWGAKLRHDFVPTTLRSCAFWAPMHVLNFLWVPPHFRVLFLSTGLVGWTAYLSIVGHRGGPETEEDGLAAPVSVVGSSAR